MNDIEQIINVFTNYLWANLPGNYTIEQEYKNNILRIHISNYILDTEKPICTKRYYHINVLNKNQDDLLGMAIDASEEIMSFFSKRAKNDKL